MSKTKQVVRKTGAKNHRVKERKLYIAITDVLGIEVGHSMDLEHSTGTTAIPRRCGGLIFRVQRA